jgi:hypothetical protein
VQVAIICGALMFGGAALSVLPRMSELNKAKNDEAIQGRVMAFKHGYKMITTTNRGVGYRLWAQSFLAEKYRFPQTKKPKMVQYAENKFKRVMPTPMPIVLKAPHSSYVCIGAELGYPGFFLHFGVLCCCLRTLVTARTATPDEERIRRILFNLIVCYAVSSWIVDFEYRPTFFMFAAATAALHRHLRGINAKRNREQEEAAMQSRQPAIPAWRIQPLPAPSLEGSLAQMGAPTAVPTMEPLPTPEPESESREEPASRIGLAWNRIGWVDLAITLAITYAAVRYWSYLIVRM